MDHIIMGDELTGYVSIWAARGGRTVNWAESRTGKRWGPVTSDLLNPGETLEQFAEWLKW